jgi:hypothetical protein
MDSRRTLRLFPPPTGIQINMLPFIIGNDHSIPREYRGYSHLIQACTHDKEDHGKVGCVARILHVYTFCFP